jgi:hypothetical protein
MSKRGTSNHGAVLACVLAFGVEASGRAARGQVVRQGSEFVVNSFTLNSQNEPAVAVAVDGDFVVTWSDDFKESSSGVFAARFDSAGAPLGGEFRVNTYTYSIQRRSSVAAESNGDFVVVWDSYRQDDQASPYSYGVFGQRFTSAGVAVGTEFQINAYTERNQRYARVASDNDGDFVVVWSSAGQDAGGYSYGVFARRFSSAGAALATEFMVNTVTAERQDFPAIALDAEGDFVVVWESLVQDGHGYGVFGQRFSSTGARLGGEFQVNSYTSSNQNRAVVAAEGDGDFVVVWQSGPEINPQDGSVLGVFGQRFSSAGVRQAAEFQVNQYTLYSQRSPEIAADASGDFIVTWESADDASPQDGDDTGVFARRLNAGGPFGPEFMVNLHTLYRQQGMAVDWDDDGAFVIAWSSLHQDGNLDSVVAQRFSLPPLATLDIDANGELDALTDGLLALRHFFGFSGPTLVSGATASSCGRCAAADITSYLNGLGLVLDIDDTMNVGDPDALTDGLLILRFLFGFTGAALTNGAVAMDCGTRCSSADILTYLQTLD